MGEAVLTKIRFLMKPSVNAGIVDFINDISATQEMHWSVWYIFQVSVLYIERHLKLYSSYSLLNLFSSVSMLEIIFMDYINSPNGLKGKKII